MSLDSEWQEFEKCLDLASSDIPDEQMEFNKITPTINKIVSKRKTKIKEDHRICPNCNIMTISTLNEMVCHTCGFTKIIKAMPSNVYSGTLKQNHNTKKGFVKFHIVGKQSGKYNKSLMSTSANYEEYRRVKNEKILTNTNRRFAGDKVPKSAIKLTIKWFEQIKRTHKIVYRTARKTGLLSALLYHACRHLGISKTPTQIAKLMNVADKFHSRGDRQIYALKEMKIINIPTLKIDPTKDYINSYFISLQIDNKYKDFTFDLIKHAEDNHIHIIYPSKFKTRCVGAIYVVIQQIRKYKKTITRDMIKSVCEISVATFRKYHAMIFSHPGYFRKIFKAHKIPMPVSWKPVKKM